MATGFDPYHKWLAIPPAEQPPNLYRLLGLAPFESDPDVIGTAAHHRVAHLRAMQGPHFKLSQDLISEVVAARGCLLNHERKAAYDAELRVQIALQTAPQALPLASVAAADSGPQVSMPESAPEADSSASGAFDFLSEADRPVVARFDSANSDATLAPRRVPAWAQWLIIATPVLGVAAVTAAIMIVGLPGAGHLPISRGHHGGAELSLRGANIGPHAAPVDPPKKLDSAGKDATAESNPDERTAGGNSQLNSDAPQKSSDDGGPAATVNRPSGTASDGSGSDKNSTVPNRARSPTGESWAAQAKALVQASKSGSTLDQSDLLRKALGLLNKAEGADRWSSEALELVKTAQVVAPRTSEGVLVAGWLRTTELRIRGGKKIADGVPAARDGLANKPDEPEANGLVGGFLCFQMDEWADGLKHLAKGSDAALAEIAALDQSSPAAPLDQFHLANSWHGAANKLPGAASNPWYEPMRARAVVWYRKCVSGLKGPAASMAQARIADQEAVQAESDALANGKFKFPLGEPIDILPFVNTNSSIVVAGNWSRNGQEISVEPGPGSRILFPVVVNGSYEVEIEFTRTANQTLLWMLVPVGQNSCAVFLSHMSGGDSGLDQVNGFSPNDARNPIAVRPGNLQNGHRYRLFVSVRIDADDDASIDVALDGRPYFPHWNGDPATLSHADDGHPGELGLGANWCGVTFHSARLRLLSGSATLNSR